MQIQCNNCSLQHLVRKIFIHSWKQLKECEESQGRSNKIYSHTLFFRMLVLRTHTFTSSTVHEGQLQTFKLFMPRFYMLPYWGSKKPPQLLLNINNFGNGLSIMQSSALRSWKKTANTLKTLEQYSLHQKTLTLLRFPWIWFSLEPLHPQTTERKKN